jgi:hypothetical protein
MNLSCLRDACAKEKGKGAVDRSAQRYCKWIGAD